MRVKPMTRSDRVNDFRNRAIKSARRIVVKVGSAVLTSPNGLDSAMIISLATQLSQLHSHGLDVVLVSSGAVAAGRRVIATTLEAEGLPAKQAASAIGQSRLMHAYDEAFGRSGKVSAQILVSKDGLESRRRFLHARNTLVTLLRWRAIPVVNENDTVAVEELQFGDNDFLASLIVNLVEADLMINLTSAGGVFEQNPDQVPDAKCLEYISDIDALDLESMCSGKTTVGSGGMYTKLLAARRVAQLGVPSLIVSGRMPDALLRIFSGEQMGTWIMPREKTVSRRKYWMAYNQEVTGSVIVDAGAARALVHGGKSLLPAGITAVDGDFEAGALLRISTQGGDSLGVGLTNYDAEALRRIMGSHSSQIASLLGHDDYPEAIHRDNLLIDPAL